MGFRQATPEDATAVREIARASWEADYPGTVSRETIDEGVSDWYSRERIETAVEESRTVVHLAEVDGEPVGFVHAVYDGSEGTILRLYVHPDSRREGIATELLDHVLELLYDQEVDTIAAMALAENRPARAFYEHAGFVERDRAETTVGDETHEEIVYVYDR